MSDQTELLEKITATINNMESFLTKDSTTGAVARDARNTAEELLRKFEEDLSTYQEAAGTHFDDANLAFVWQLDTLKQKVADLTNLQEANIALSHQVEKQRHDYEQVIREKNDAVKELDKLQKLWERATAG